MNQTAKKGDLAVIVDARHTTLADVANQVESYLPGTHGGAVVTVLSDPQFIATVGLTCNHVSAPEGSKYGDREFYVETKCLLVIADPDAGITRTTEREVAA